MQVKKRDGRLVSYDRSKIMEAIDKASGSIGVIIHPEDRCQVIDSVEFKIGKCEHIPDVEDIQDWVVEELLSSGLSGVAIAYIRYRERRAIARKRNEVDAIDLINEYLNEDNPEHDMAVRENSSTGFSLQGLHNHIFGKISEKKWLSYYSDEIQKAHNDGMIHIHDLQSLSGYCSGWDLKQLLEEGFTGVADKTTSKPAKHFNAALLQMVNFIYTLQGEFAGAQAFSNFNTLLAPFVAADELTYKQVKQCIQEFVYNLNISTRVGFQAPFSNLTIDLDVTKTKFAEIPAIISGKNIDKCYKEFSKEAAMITQALVEVLDDGDGDGKMFPYPIVTINITKDFPWDNKLGESILKVTAKNGSFYFGNFINSEFAESDIKSMCCRLRLNLKEIDEYMQSTYAGGLDDAEYEKAHIKGGGFFGASEDTGSIGCVTQNLAGIADRAIKHYKLSSSCETLKDHYEKELKHYMDLSIESLQKKRKVIEEMADRGLYPYTKHYLRHIKERTGRYFSQHFSTICTNAGHEAIYLLRKNGDWKANIKAEENNKGICDEAGYTMAKEILKYMHDYTIELQKKHKILINLEQAPAESAGIKLCKRSGIDPFNVGYYTNSTWIPAEYNMDLYDQIKHQGKLNEFYTGGSSYHTYADADISKAYKDIKKLILFAFTETKLPYITISPVVSFCKTHGRLTGKIDKCPQCGEKTQIFARIVGYYRPMHNWNKGKKKEFGKRKFMRFD